MVEKIMKWHSVTKWLLPLAILSTNQVLAHETFPPAGVDNTSSLGKFSLRLNQKAGQAWLGIPDCPWGNSLCLVHSPTLNDSNTQIGRSTPHREDDPIDKDEGARICQNGDNDSCSGYVKKPVKDSDFVFPPLNSMPFEEGPSGIKEIHTQILSLNMTDQGQCGYNLSKDAVRAGINFKLSPSIGEVEALNSSSDFPAESFFNMFVEVDVDLKSFGVKTLYNKEPLVIQNGNLTGFPPQVVYQHDANTTSPLVYDRNTNEEIGWVELAGHGVGYNGCDQASRAAFDSFYDQLVKANLDKINKDCYPVLPQPELKVLGRYNYEENGQSWSRYRLVIANADSFPPALFTPAPQLPSCGLNTSSSRTWVDIYQNNNSGPRLYGFCALNSPTQLKDIWFALPQAQKPPKCLQVELNDRQCNTKYASNVLCDYPLPLIDEFGNEITPQPGSSTSGGKTTIEVGKGPIDICQLVPSLCQDPKVDQFKITIKLSISGRAFAGKLTRPKARDETTLALSAEQSRAFIESLQASLAELNLSELVIETDGYISRLEIPIFSAKDSQTPQAWYSVFMGNPVAIESKDTPVTGIIPDPSGLLSFVFLGNEGKYYQSLLIPALHPLITEAITEAFPDATLAQSPEGIITFTRDNQTTQFRLSYVVTPTGTDLDPLQVNSVDTDGDNQADLLTISAHGRSQQLEIVK